MVTKGQLVRSRLINQVAGIISTQGCTHPLRVGIDGVDGAGKTFLTDELVTPIEEYSRSVIRASIDGFHNPRNIRYRRGKDSPEGYYRDSFNNEAIITNLLHPLGPGGNLEYRLAIYDCRNDRPVQSPCLVAPKNAVLLFDGVFLHRPMLSPFWDFSIFIDVDFDVSVSRAVDRDMGGERKSLESEKYERKFLHRYAEGQVLYLQKVRPKDLASLVVNNNDLKHPYLI